MNECWERQRLLYIGQKDRSSMLFMLPSDIINNISNIMNMYTDLVDLIKNYEPAHIGPQGYSAIPEYIGQFTIIYDSPYVNKGLFEQLPMLSYNPDYLFVINGNV